MAGDRQSESWHERAGRGNCIGRVIDDGAFITASSSSRCVVDVVMVVYCFARDCSKASVC